MEVFVGHTLLLGGISLDVDDISHTVVYEERREFRWTGLCTES
jgi:hypothetical protein